MKNVNYYDNMYRVEFKLLKNINYSVSVLLTIISIIGIIEFVRFCFDLYVYLH